MKKHYGTHYGGLRLFVGNLYRYVLSITWTAIWGEYRYHKLRKYWPDDIAAQAAYMWKRQEDPTSIKCFSCGWRGPVRWLIHKYRWDGWDGWEDAEPIDLCPNCTDEI